MLSHKGFHGVLEVISGFPVKINMTFKGPILVSCVHQKPKKTQEMPRHFNFEEDETNFPQQVMSPENSEAGSLDGLDPMANPEEADELKEAIRDIQKLDVYKLTFEPFSGELRDWRRFRTVVTQFAT